MRHVNEPAAATSFRARLPGLRRIAWTRRPARILYVAALSLAPFLSCRTPAGGPLLGLVPGLAPDIAARLVDGDARSFAAYARSLDVTNLVQARTALMLALARSGPRFDAMERELLPYIRTLLSALSEDFHLAYLSRALTAYERLPEPERRESLVIFERQMQIVRNQRLTAGERASACESLIEAARPFAQVLNIGDIYAPYCEALPRLNRDSELPGKLEIASQYALTFGDTALACQFLGALGTYYGHRQDAAAMKVAWDRALELARASRSWHEARILSFYASFYRTSGDPARAVALLAEAEERCRQLGVEDAEIRFLFARLSLFCDLSCWDLVERGLRRADVLIRAGEGRGKETDRPVWIARTLALRMRLALARGREAEARRHARDVLRVANRRPPGPDRERLRLAAADVLARCGEVRQAQKLLRRITQDCIVHSVGELLPECRLKTAEVCLAAGDRPGSALALTLYRAGAAEEDTAASEEWLRHDFLAARLAWQEGDRAGALGRLAGAVQRLERCCAGMGVSPEAGLTLNRYEDLRFLFHEITAGDPLAGYRFEMAWSNLRFGNRSPRDDGPAAEVQRFIRKERTLPPLPAAAVHCIYAWNDSVVVRWTRDGDTVTRCVLATTPGPLAGRLDRVLSRLSAAATGASRDPAVLKDLRDLAHLLLPAEFFAPGGDHRMLLVTRDGPLARLPFEALDTGNGIEPHPLLLERDVAYLNSLAGSSRALCSASPGGPVGKPSALVVAAPRYDGDLTRRWAILNEPIPEGIREAGQFATAMPNAVVLEGAAASRDAVIARWEDARWIYLAAHVVRDPELSYLERIPLAGSPRQTPFIEILDVQRADLSSCDLVVLSGCETGVRYFANGTIPSLGDLFAKAGARAVIQTGWSVRDEEGAALMHAFTVRFAKHPTDPVAALCGARRELISQGAPPSVWAAYTVLVGGGHPDSSASTFSDAAWKAP